MVIDRRLARILAAWVGVLAALIAGIFNIARCHAAAPHIPDAPAAYRAAMDSNDPQPLSDQGSIVAWGAQRIDRSVFDAQFIAIAAGTWHSLALKKDGSIVGWGSNSYGQASPPDGNDFIAIAAGYSHSLAIRRPEPPAAP
jgi:hypothetical protein